MSFSYELDNNNNDLEAARQSSLSRQRTPLAEEITRSIREERAARTRSRTSHGTPQGLWDKDAPEGVALGTSSDDDDKTLVSWEDNDLGNPHNWPTLKKNLILCLAMMLIVNSTMSSALPSNAIPFIADQYGISSPQQKILPISVFMIGFVCGPIVWGPLSEQYGRRVVILGSFAAFCLWTMACALAPGFAVLVVFRLFVGCFASAAIAVVPGIIADTYGDHRTRGRAMAVFMAATCFGPLFAPIISGFVSPTIGWRWSFWIGLMYAGVTFVPLIFLPETYSPVLLSRRARALREAAASAGNTDDEANHVSPRDLEPKPTLTELATVVLARPLRMIVSEPIVSCTCAYLALVYAIFYMSFQAFPIIYGDLYGLSPGVMGLAFLPIGGGSLLALPVFLAYDPVLAWARRRADEQAQEDEEEGQDQDQGQGQEQEQQTSNPPALGRKTRTRKGRQGLFFSRRSWRALLHREEARRLPLACVGGPLFVASLFWLGFSARPGVSVAVPILAGLPFGAGFILIFMALLNYLTDAYEVYAASANGAASMARSLLAVVLPLATAPMFARLGIAGACALLGGMSALMCAIPFVFIWQGERIREGSRFCAVLREQKLEMERRVEAQRRRKEARAAAAAAAAAEKEREEEDEDEGEDGEAGDGGAGGRVDQGTATAARLSPDLGHSPTGDR